MGRDKKLITIEEKKLAKKLANQKYYKNNKAILDEKSRKRYYKNKNL